jgi:hypothetical protein
VTPSLEHNIWPGVWFTGENGPEGWIGTSAPLVVTHHRCALIAYFDASALIKLIFDDPARS